MGSDDRVSGPVMGAAPLRGSESVSAWPMSAIVGLAHVDSISVSGMTGLPAGREYTPELLRGIYRSLRNSSMKRFMRS